jgi:hypothetical protein
MMAVPAGGCCGGLLQSAISQHAPPLWCQLTGSSSNIRNMEQLLYEEKYT